MNKLAKFGKFGILILLVAVVIFFMPQIARFVTEYLWYAELGYQSVFLKLTFAKFAIGFVVFLLVFLLSFLTLQMTTRYQPEIKTEDDTVINVPNDKTGGKRILALIPSIVLGLLAGYLAATTLWQSILLFLNQSAAGVTDPVFHRDISFYFFNLSLLETVYALAFLFVSVIFLCNLLMTIYLQGFSKKTFKVMGARLVYFIVALFLLLIIGFQLRAANLLYAQNGAVFGAGYTDLRVTLPMYYAASAACVLSAITLVAGLKKHSLKIAVIGPVALIVVLAVGYVAASGVQSFIVKPAEIAKEQPYITNNIEMTNRAYGLDSIEEVEFAANGTLTATDLQEEMDTIKNVRLIDYRPTITVFNQLQSMRLYYKFVDVDIDRYHIDGSQQQVYLAARELDQSSLDVSAQNWINKYVKYTHGYGAVVSPVNQITSQGQPEMWVENIPPTTTVPELEITRPEIYYGQLTNDYVIVNTKEPEFDYPIGDTNAQSVYEGDAGISMNLFNRALFALNEHDYKILVSNLITGDSKMLMHRNIQERAQRIAPFLTLDVDPYLVIDEGRLIWVIDAYTSSDKYPYATRVTNTDSAFYGKNYIRNSAKVTVDAYTGETTFYIVDDSDPLIKCYANMFPGLFKPMSEMSDTLQHHLKYSTTLFEVQTEIYQRYHMKNPTVFYNKEDVWSISNELYGNQTTKMEPYFVNMRLPGSNQLEFLLMRPFTPTQKQNMVSWLAARNDGDNYGKLVLFKFPKQSTIYGPMQVESRISNDSEISQNLNLWDQQGSSVIRSNLLVIPIKNSILYVEPIYLTTNNENSLPEVVRIVVAYKDKIVMARTLDDALSQLFGTDFRTEGVTVEDEGNSSFLTYDEIIEELKAAYQNAKTAQQEGDWSSYGLYMDQLEQAIGKLSKTGTDAANTPSDNGNLPDNDATTDMDDNYTGTEAETAAPDSDNTATEQEDSNHGFHNPFANL